MENKSNNNKRTLKTDNKIENEETLQSNSRPKIEVKILSNLDLVEDENNLNEKPKFVSRNQV